MRAKGAKRLTAAWRWADKLERATAKELELAPNEMAKSVARVRQQEADRHATRCEAEEADNSLRTGKRQRTRELVASGCRNNGPPRRDY